MSQTLKNLLSGYGYNMVALPKSDIHPLMLLYKNGPNVSPLQSNLEKLFAIGSAVLPEIEDDIVGTEISGNAAIKMDANGGISFLDKLLKQLNLGKLSGTVKFEDGSNILISYKNIVEEKIDLAALDTYLKFSKPQLELFNTYKSKLLDSEMFVINSVLRSNELSIEITDKKGKNLDANATFKGVLDINVAANTNNDSAIVLKSDGNNSPVTFAFKAQQIIYDRKKWWQFFKTDEDTFYLKDALKIEFRSNEDFPSIEMEASHKLIEL